MYIYKISKREKNKFRKEQYELKSYKDGKLVGMALCDTKDRCIECYKTWVEHHPTEYGALEVEA